jgi:hypothetical protein
MVSLLVLQQKIRRARAHPRPRNKKPGAVSRPGVSAQFW